MVYSGSNLLYMLQPEGTVSKTTDGYAYNYFKTDHTGSTRMLLSAVDGNLVQQQATDYYPFGMAWSVSNLNKNKYLFSGKEFQDDRIGAAGVLGLYDFGARYYNPLLGRWFNVDPKLQGLNPYAYCGNSPVMYVDPDGQFAWAIFIVFAGGGVLNVGVHGLAGDIDSWDRAFGYFATGCIGTAGTMINPLMGAALWGAGDAAVAMGRFDVNAMLTGATMSAITAGAGNLVSKPLAPLMDKLTGWIGNPMLEKMASRGMTYAATGFATTTGIGLLNGQDFGDAFKQGAQSAAVGFGLGAVTGGIGWIKEAKKQGVDFWNGESKGSIPEKDMVTAKDLGLEKTMERIERGEKHPHHRDGTTYHNGEGFLPAQKDGYYQEFVHPTNGVKGPGPQRIVRGENGELYYAPEHYENGFIKIKR